ncbi:MAG: hypothetical protein KGY70_14505 [Bacteroidales bacterium]|nr:hypothetical protein [Bacteroidales bacterium]
MDLKNFIYTEKAYETNLARYVDDDKLAEIGEAADREYEVDFKSCSDWWQRTEPAIKLAMQVYEKKNFPFEGASNVKYPLLNVAATQFASRAYPAIMKGKEVVKAKVIGNDALPNPQNPQQMIPGEKSAIAERISKHMSWQLTEQMEEWEEDLDRALTTLPIIGEEWKKTYFDSILKRNKSCRVLSEFIVMNYWAKSARAAARVSEKIYLYPNDVEEKKRTKHFLDQEYSENMGSDKRQDEQDEDSPLLFIEQHRFLDLDEDGYKEPYIVTYHKDSKKVARIYPRFEQRDVYYTDDGKRIAKIVPTQYYTQTVFFPSPDGGSRGMGFGNMLNPINEAINSLINQIIDSGTLYNSNAGFIGKGAQLSKGKGRDLQFKLGEWKEVSIPGDDLRKNIFPLPVKEPSSVLFSMLGTLIESGEKMSSVAEVMTGQSQGANASPTTTMALIEQGMQVFGSVYKRIHRSLKEEFKKLYRLNAIYLPEEEYFRVMDDLQAVTRMDYNMDAVDVVPVSDPKEVSDTQKLIKAQAVMELLGSGLNDQEIRRYYLEAIGMPEVDRFMLPDEALNQPDPELVLKERDQQLKEQEFEWKMVVDKANMQKVVAMAEKALAEAEEAAANADQAYAKADYERAKPELEVLKEQTKLMDSAQERIMNERVQRMANSSGNSKSAAKGSENDNRS